MRELVVNGVDSNTIFIAPNSYLRLRKQICLKRRLIHMRTGDFSIGPAPSDRSDLLNNLGSDRLDRDSDRSDRGSDRSVLGDPPQSFFFFDSSIHVTKPQSIINKSKNTI